jgi:hypothetical protein
MESAQVVRYLFFAGSALCGVMAVTATLALRKEKAPLQRKRLVFLAIGGTYLGIVTGLIAARLMPARFVMPLLLLYWPFAIWRWMALKKK